jgi:hypothetical protein
MIVFSRPPFNGNVYPAVCIFWLPVPAPVKCASHPIIAEVKVSAVQVTFGLVAVVAQSCACQPVATPFADAKTTFGPNSVPMICPVPVALIVPPELTVIDPPEFTVTAVVTGKLLPPPPPPLPPPVPVNEVVMLTAAMPLA